MKLILLHHSVQDGKIIDQFSQTPWLLFSREAERKKYWINALNPTIRINYKQDLREVSYSLGDEFVNWTNSIGKDNWSNKFWWITRLATRSNAISPLYLYICYLTVLKKEILTSSATSLLIISESWELLEAIEKNFYETCKIEKPGGYLKSKVLIKDIIFEQIRFPLVWLSYLFFGACDWLFSRITSWGEKSRSEILTDPDHVIIHTCIDNFCLKENGKFEDRYFPGLKEYFEKHNKKVSVLTWFSNITKINRFDTFRWFRNNDQSFIIPQDFYNLWDIFLSMFVVIKSGYLPIKNVLFNNFDLEVLLICEQKLQRRNTGAAYFINHIKMFENFKAKGYSVQTFVDTWELKFCEVPALIGLKTNFPECKTIGIQHTALVPRLLFANYKTTTEEFNSSIHADILLTNSEVTKLFLSSEGFPMDKIHIGPAFRYRYLNQKTTLNQIIQERAKTILVCLPMSVESASELLWICKGAFCDMKFYNVLIKCHPFLGIDKISSNIDFDLPNNFEAVNGVMEFFLSKADYLIVSGSSVMMEGLTKSIFTLVMANDTDIDLIPADMFETNLGWSYFSNPIELRKSIDYQELRGNYKQINSEYKRVFEYSFKKLDDIFLTL